MGSNQTPTETTEGTNPNATFQPMLSETGATLDAANVAALAFIGFQERITEITDELDERETELDNREEQFEGQLTRLQREIDPDSASTGPSIS